MGSDISLERLRKTMKNLSEFETHITGMRVKRVAIVLTHIMQQCHHWQLLMYSVLNTSSS